jgi:drug/metabolite transporter (DMT)-like permease
VQPKKKQRDPKVLMGLMMGGGSLIAGATRMHLFDSGIDWFFWSMVAVFLTGIGIAIWYIRARRLHAQTRTFIDRPARKPAPRHDEPTDS